MREDLRYEGKGKRAKGRGQREERLHPDDGKHHPVDPVHPIWVKTRLLPITRHLSSSKPQYVVPAEAGIQTRSSIAWIPVFTGMTSHSKDEGGPKGRGQGEEGRNGPPITCHAVQDNEVPIPGTGNGSCVMRKPNEKLCIP